MTQSRYLRREKRALSTILGTIIAVGILFTVVIPLFLYVNDVNNAYNATLQSMEDFDRQRDQEDLTVYAYPVENSTRLNVQIINVSPYYVLLKRLWIMDLTHDGWRILTPSNLEELQEDIDPGTDMLITGIDLSFTGGEKTTICVYVTTSRGNVFASQTNPITLHEGEWSSGQYPFLIQFVFETKYQGGGAWIERTISTKYVGPDPEISWNSTNTFTLQAKAHSLTVCSVGVPCVGNYEVKIYDTKTQQLVWGPKVVYVTWETPSPWVYVPKP